MADKFDDVAKQLRGMVLPELDIDIIEKSIK